MVSLLRATVFAVVTLIVVVFALCNRETVALTLNPLGSALNVPLFLVGLGGLGIGFVAGALLLWSRSLALRLAARRQVKRIAALERDLESADAFPAETLPALPARNAYAVRAR